jgi:hypothetical protein
MVWFNRSFGRFYTLRALREINMRMLLGVIGLIVALAIVATLARKQLSAVSEIKLPQASGVVPGAAPLTLDPNAGVQQQSQQLQQQIKQSVESSLQLARPMPDDK